MGLFTRAESAVSESVETLFTRHDKTQPIDLAVMVQRSLHRGRVRTPRSTYIPNHIAIRLPASLHQSWRALLGPLRGEMVAHLDRWRESSGFQVLAPLRVDFHAGDEGDRIAIETVIEGRLT